MGSESDTQSEADDENKQEFMLKSNSLVRVFCRLLVNENPMIHDDQSANLESFKDDNTVSDGYQLISDYRLKVAS